MPWIQDDKLSINYVIGKDLLDAYFNLKNQRLNGETAKVNDSKDEQNT
ncbi:penicillin-binding protein [Bacillus thuringiensis]|nr:penicillin-binding protein [Bacillus thuringiensis]